MTADSAPSKKTRLITQEELESHNSEKDCWVAIHGLVINVDKSLQNEHPGGPEVIFALAGRDVTDDFEDIGHSDAAREWCDRLIIGHTDPEKEGKLMPRNKDLGGGGGQGGMGVLPLIFAIAVGIAAYMFYFQQ